MHKHSGTVVSIASFPLLSGLLIQLLPQPFSADFSVRSVHLSRSPVLTQSTGEHLGVVATIGGEDASTMSMASGPHPVHQHPLGDLVSVHSEAVLGG
jgi:hypothetical protein